MATGSLWAQIEANEPARLIQNLRQVGCPEQTIRELSLLRIARKYRQQLLKAETETARSVDYTRNLPQAHWNRRRELQRQLVEEMRAELEALLGTELDSLRRSVLMLRPCGSDRTDFLPAGQRRKVREIEGRYHELKHDLDFRAMMGLLDAEDRAKLQQLEIDKRAELAKVLTSCEFQEYLFRNSAAAAYVLNNMPEARAEQEFRQMVQVALEMNMFDEPVSFQQRYGIPGTEDPGAKELEARKTAFEERVKQVLGEQCLWELKVAEQKRIAEEQQRREQQSKEKERARIIDLAAPLGISAEETNRLVQRLDELRPAMDSKFNELHKNLSGTPEEKHKQVQTAMRVELEKIAVEILGEKGRQLAHKLWDEHR